jgi:hypothetical protein
LALGFSLDVGRWGLELRSRSFSKNMSAGTYSTSSCKLAALTNQPNRRIFQTFTVGEGDAIAQPLGAPLKLTASWLPVCNAASVETAFV